jgi:hypothetical protein
MRSLWVVLMIVCGARHLQAQPSYTADVQSVDAIVAALYDVISGPAGQVRDSVRFAHLFLPQAQLCAHYTDSLGRMHLGCRNSQKFYEGLRKFTRDHGFYESEIGRRTEQWENMAHVWSSYASRNDRTDAKPFAQGINSIQLFHDGSRWWVLSVYWQPLPEGKTMPKNYLKHH